LANDSNDGDTPNTTKSPAAVPFAQPDAPELPGADDDPDVVIIDDENQNLDTIKKLFTGLLGKPSRDHPHLII
jgi:hypothetical protein